ncbi:hypothetical protein [Echinicola sp. 20G]|uniref:hypothetical protein n=1 Tax=Echinicola sp. 20G TaxID=2781961 RepID=UPI001910EB62|nr:hypothetical protein [Echinicola sp. 20G]
MLPSGLHSYSNWNPTWNNLIGDESSAATDQETTVLREKVANGPIDTRGTFVDVPNGSIETTSTGSRRVMSDSQMRWYPPPLIPRPLILMKVSDGTKKMETHRFLGSFPETKIVKAPVWGQAEVKPMPLI